MCFRNDFLQLQSSSIKLYQTRTIYSSSSMLIVQIRVVPGMPNSIEEDCRCFKCAFEMISCSWIKRLTSRGMSPFTRVCGIFEDHRYLSAQIVPVLFQ